MQSIPSRINLTIDDQFKKVLAAFKAKFPLLNEPDIIKMAVSGYFTDHFVDEYTLTEEEDQELKKAYESGFIKKPKSMSTDSFLDSVANDPTYA
jgi:predicted DNA binding protein